MLVSSSNLRYQPYPQLSHFPWLCAWDVCYIIFCQLLHIHSGKTGILFSLSLCSLWWVQIVEHALDCWSCSLVRTVHHLIIIIVQIYQKTYTICLIIIIKSEVWTIIDCLGLGHETMVCAVCFSIYSQDMTKFGSFWMRPNDNDSTGLWPPGSLHTLGADGHI